MEYSEIDWDKAACRKVGSSHYVRYDQDTFSEIDPEPQYKESCKYCVIRQDCYQYALDTYQEGWWGGTSARRRDRIRRKLRAENTTKED